MQVAIYENNLEKIKKLVNDPIIRRDLEGFAYHVARGGNREVAEYFFNLPGININGGTGGSCMSPLKEAIRYNNKEVIEFLLNHPRLDINMKPCRGFGESVLKSALLSRKPHVVELLLRHPRIEIDDDELDLFVEFGMTKLLFESTISQSVLIRLFTRHPEIVPPTKELANILGKRASNRRQHAVIAKARANANEDDNEPAGGAGAPFPTRKNTNRNSRRNNRRRSTRRARSA